MVRRTYDYDRGLLTHCERLCVGGVWSEKARLFMDHHSDKLSTIRTICARTRRQLIWQVYTYLRDGQRTKYVSSELQLKWSEAVREKLEEMEAKMERWTTERGNLPPPRDNNRDENTC